MSQIEHSGPPNPDSPSPDHSQTTSVALAPQQHRPVATWTFMAINILVWAMMTVWGGSTDPKVLVAFGAKVNELIVQGQLWRLVTPIFLHIGIVHLAFNTYAIYGFGSQIERFYGTPRFLGLYLVSGVAGVVASFSFSPNPSAGASSAVFGLLGTEAVFFYRYRNTFGRRGQQRLYNILIVIGYNLALTFVAPSIDVWGHLGGLVSGAALSWWLMPRYAVALTARGPALVDKNRPRQWSKALIIAAVCLIVCALLSVSLRAAQY